MKGNDMKRQIVRWMSDEYRSNQGQYVDPLTDEFEATRFAEACAQALNHPEWLDQPDHEVFEQAAVFAFRYEDEQQPV